MAKIENSSQHETLRVDLAERSYDILIGQDLLAELGGAIAQVFDKTSHAVVMFDANVGYHLSGEFMNDAAMSKLLKLPKDRVLVAPRGTPADEMILQAARDLGARIVTNDRYRDWVEAFPEITDPGYLIQGRYQQGDVKLLTEA